MSTGKSAPHTMASLILSSDTHPNTNNGLNTVDMESEQLIGMFTSGETISLADYKTKIKSINKVLIKK